MRFISFFAGIGGFDLGLERAGHKCVAQVEIDPFCLRVLAKHWPDVPKFGDIRELTGTDLPFADIACGGFPCQDVSNAGKRTGISGERSGLYRELLRCLRVVGYRHVIMENVAALLGRGMGEVLGDVAQVGHDAEWDCLPACAFGARHLRDRVFILTTAGTLDDADGIPQRRLAGQPDAVRRWESDNRIRRAVGWGPWAAESSVDRTAYGIPRSLDRKCLCGNAVVPQVAEYIGRLLSAPILLGETK
jgi:DNA (cytosine-5)-methyltransferase 1